MSVTPRGRRFLTLLLAGALVVGAPLALSGCSAIKDAIESQTGGNVDLGGKEIPADFPTEVPLIEGEVVYGAAIGDDAQKVWNVTIKVGDGALDQITTQLEDAGFTSTPVTETSQGSAVTFTMDDFGVLVIVGNDSDGNPIAIYTVTKGSSAG